MGASDTIFRYGGLDIQNTLECFDMETLRNLHKSLCEKVVSCYPRYKDRQPVYKQVKHIILPDVVNLVYSISTGQTLATLDKIFTKPDASEVTAHTADNDSSQDIAASIADVLKIVVSLCIKISIKKEEDLPIALNNLPILKRLTKHSYVQPLWVLATRYFVMEDWTFKTPLNASTWKLSGIYTKLCVKKWFHAIQGTKTGDQSTGK